MPKITIKDLDNKVNSKFDRIDNSIKDLLGSITTISSKITNMEASIKRILAKHTSEIWYLGWIYRYILY